MTFVFGDRSDRLIFSFMSNKFDLISIARQHAYDAERVIVLPTLSVRPSRRGVVSKRTDISPNFFHHLEGTVVFFSSNTVTKFNVSL